MSQCKRPCVVALSGPGRFTYLFGDLDPARDTPAVVAALRLYLAKPDGFMERAERPPPLQAGILGRVPPLGDAGPLVMSEVALLMAASDRSSASASLIAPQPCRPVSEEDTHASS